MELYKVRDIMTINPVKINQDKNILECAQLLREKSVGSLLVMNKDKFAGIITELDLVLKVLAEKKDPESLTVKDIMTDVKEIISIEPEKTFFDAMLLMKDNDIRRVPVMKNDELLGLITMKDVLGVEPDLLEQMFEKY